MDKLDKIFRLQEDLNIKIGIDTRDLPVPQQIIFAQDFGKGLQQELADFMNKFPWRWWLKEQKFDIDGAKECTVDMVHYIISIAQILGLTPEDLLKQYEEKNEQNKNKQDAAIN